MRVQMQKMEINQINGRRCTKTFEYWGEIHHLILENHIMLLI